MKLRSLLHATPFKQRKMADVVVVVVEVVAAAVDADVVEAVEAEAVVVDDPQTALPE
jgi:hypothetical protein